MYVGYLLEVLLAMAEEARLTWHVHVTRWQETGYATGHLHPKISTPLFILRHLLLLSAGMPQYDMSDLVGSLRLLPCRQEPSYRARRTGATLTRILFRRFTAHELLLEELDLPKLAGDASENGGTVAAAATAAQTVQARSLTETAVLVYGEVVQVVSSCSMVSADAGWIPCLLM